jgi:sarcosine oxidase subunit gamma
MSERFQPYDGLARIEALPPRDMVVLRADFTAPRAREAVLPYAAGTFPGTNETRLTDEGGVLWMAPDEVMVLAPSGQAATVRDALTQSLEGVHHLALDVSGARLALAVEGERAREVLAKLTPADLRRERFQPGVIRRTRLAQVPAAIWPTSADRFELLVFRSVGEYVYDLLRTAAAEGSAVSYPL